MAKKNTPPFKHGQKSTDRLLAALDLGTNNCRLLIARPQRDAFFVVSSFSRIVRLGAGLAASGRLGEPAMSRTLEALKACARLLDRHPITEVRCVATEACRRAANGLDFLNRVRQSTKIQFEVLSREDEVRYALLGCVPLIDSDAQHVLLVDIGGGSTEFAWLDRGSDRHATTLGAAVSLPIGVVSLSEMFSSEPDPPTFEAMVRYVKNLLMPIEATYRLRPKLKGCHVQMLGTSGTVTTMAAVLLNLRRYDRRRIDGLVIEPAQITEVGARLRTMSNADRRAHPCIGAGRADLVVAGCAILEALLESWTPATVRVADRGLREGLLHSLMGRTLEGALADHAFGGMPSIPDVQGVS